MANARILIVEDEGIEALDLQHRLTSLGYTAPDIVATGEDAVAKAAETHPDLILMDIMLQGAMDGVAAAAQIHARLDIPIIFLTAYADDETLRRAKVTEPSGYLVKPFKERDLHISVDMALYKHKMERRLRESEEWLRVTLTSIGDAVIACDTRGLITFLNPVASRLTGWPQQEALGRPVQNVFRIINEITRADSEDIVGRVLREGHVVGLANHTSLVTRDGREIPVEDSAAPIRDAAGNVAGVVLVFHDVTEQRRAEQELQQTNRQLAQANIAKDQFVAVLSHELRTPLTAMLGWVKMLQMHEFDKQTAKKALAVIERNVKSQTHIIEDLLDVSRIIAGKMTLEKHPIDLGGIVSETVDEFRPAAEAKKLVLRCSAPPAVFVDGDQTRLRQVIWNLLSNATKFTPDGGRVEVSLCVAQPPLAGCGVAQPPSAGCGVAQPPSAGCGVAQPPSAGSGVAQPPSAGSTGGCATLVVSDTGKGISSEFLPHIFERFRQEDSSTHRRFAGLGLGLAIVHHLVELHGGSIAAQSQGDGKGASFTVTLPLLVGQLHPVPVSESAPGELGLALRRAKILLVEDDDDSRDLMATAMRIAGADVVAVGSVSEAVAAVLQFRPTVLVSDIGMPGQDGCELIQKLRAAEKQEGRKPVPAIALTGYAQPEDAQRCRAAGFDAHLPKPIEPETLISRIAAIM